jgi:KaiC/GvpD/RAD55 family RecA-like ATPase
MTTQYPALVKAGFTVPSTTTPRRLIASVVGFDKTGKNRFSIRAPEPVMVISLDRGTEGVSEEWKAEGHDIVHTVMDRPALPLTASTQEVSRMWGEYWKKLMTLSEAAYAVGKGTLVWDTETALWEAFRLFKFGRQSQVRHMYTEVNAAYIEEVVVPSYKHTTMSTIFLNRFKEQFVDDKWDGESYTRAGLKSLHYEVQVNMELRRKDREGQPPEFSGVVLNCRVPTKGGGPNVGGTVLPGPMSDFNTLLGMVHGG